MTMLRFAAGDPALTIPPHSRPGHAVTVVRVLALAEWARFLLDERANVHYEITPLPGCDACFVSDRCLMPLRDDENHADDEGAEVPAGAEGSAR